MKRLKKHCHSLSLFQTHCLLLPLAVPNYLEVAGGALLYAFVPVLDERLRAFVAKPCCKIAVGDVVELHEGDPVPADVMLLYIGRQEDGTDRGAEATAEAVAEPSGRTRSSCAITGTQISEQASASSWAAICTGTPTL